MLQMYIFFVHIFLRTRWESKEEENEAFEFSFQSTFSVEQT